VKGQAVGKYKIRRGRNGIMHFLERLKEKKNGKVEWPRNLPDAKRI